MGCRGHVFYAQGAQCNRQGASDGLQPAFLECGLSGSGPPIGLRLRKSASLVDFFNKSLADQGACRDACWLLLSAIAVHAAGTFQPLSAAASRDLAGF